MIRVKAFLKRSPKIERGIIGLKRLFVKEQSFETSEKYWIDRYKRRGDSGPGSYNNLAEFKADTLNEFIVENDVKSVMDFGCGDGNQLTYLKVGEYMGLDVSEDTLRRCGKRFAKDESKSFMLIKDLTDEKSDLGISLDVIFHLVEDEVFTSYMKVLFDSSSRFVIIYSSDTDDPLTTSPHFKQRKFTDWISSNRPEFKLLKKIDNKYPYDGNNAKTSLSDFYIFSREAS